MKIRRTSRAACRPARCVRRRGATATFAAVALVVVLGLVGLALDTAMVTFRHRRLQSAADAAAVVAAAEMRRLGTQDVAAARAAVLRALALHGSSVTASQIQIGVSPSGHPPISEFLDSDETEPGYLQVVVTDESSISFLRVLRVLSAADGAAEREIGARAVAGYHVIEVDDETEPLLVLAE